MTLYFVAVLAEKSHTSYIIILLYRLMFNGKNRIQLFVTKCCLLIIAGWFASITVNNSECVALFAEFDQEIEIKISRKAFTWEVVFYPTYCMYNNADNILSIPVAHKGGTYINHKMYM